VFHSWGSHWRKVLASTKTVALLVTLRTLNNQGSRLINASQILPLTMQHVLNIVGGMGMLFVVTYVQYRHDPDAPIAYLFKAQCAF